jgi:PEP-CTERM motif
MKPLALMLCSLTACAAAHATQLNFDTYNGATYGDRVSVFGLGYGSEGGATPNITMDFVAQSTMDFRTYASGYGTLQNALGHVNFDVPGYFRFTPDAGFDVVLQGFDIAGWSAGSYPNSQIRIVDGSGTTLYDSGLFTFGPNTVLNLPQAPIRSSGPLTVYVNDFGDLGIDNVVFSQVSSVPEASTLAMLLAGLGLIGARGAWRRG